MRTLFIFAFVFFVSGIYGQRSGKNISLYVFDENWKGCKPEEAKYLASMEKLSDTAYEWKSYRFDGPLLTVETYKDKEVNIPHGEFIYYGEDGRIDSSGYCVNGKKNDWWYYYTDSLTIWKKEKYNMGKLISQMDHAAIEAEREQGRKNAEIEKHDELSEAVFKGGVEDWIKYIQRNLNFPDRARALKKEGTLLIEFIVNTDGTIGSTRMLRSIEYSLDEEAIRVIKKSPKWRPARMDGKAVKAYRRQPLTFQLPG